MFAVIPMCIGLNFIFSIFKTAIIIACLFQTAQLSAQCPAPAQPFFEYDGGDITFNASDSLGKCYKNLVAGQTYCFYMVQPLDTIIQIDMNMNGCNTCLNSMYADVDTYSAYVRVVGNVSGFASLNRCVTFNPFLDSLRCNFRTYDPSCNLLRKGVMAGNCNGMEGGKIYTFCFTVPPTCGGMSFCPMYKCGTCPKLRVTNETICEGECTNIEATVNGGVPPYTYNWTPNIGTGPGPFSVCPDSTTTYRVQVIDSVGFIMIDSGTVTVRNTPVLTLSPDTSICPGNQVVLNSSGGVFYFWQDSSTLSCGGCSAPVASPTDSITYFVVAYDSTRSCTDTGTIRITIFSPIPVSAGPDIQICPNSTDTLLACCGVSYLWSPSTGLSDTSIANPILNVSVTTEYRVRAADVNGCISYDTLLATVLSDTFANTGPDISICYGDSTSLSVCCGVSYQWSPVTDLSNTSIQNPVFTGLNTTRYFVTVTDVNGCTSVDSMLITVFPALSLTITDSSEICTGSSVTLTVCCGQSFQWSPSAGLSNTSISNPIASPSASTTYSVTVTDINGCSADTNMIVMVHPNPVVNITPSNPVICSGELVTLQAQGNGVFNWSTGETTSTIVITPGSSGLYSVTVTDPNQCTASANTTVTVEQRPNANAGADETIFKGESVALNATGGNNYFWFPSADLSCSNCANPIATPNSDVQYCVVVSNLINCSDTDCVFITVVPDIHIFIPNVFSPNLDGSNDYFRLYGNLENVKQVEVNVWNRWGEKMFYSNDIYFSWDGLYQGKRVLPGVYVYVVKLVTITDSNARSYKGSLTILE